MPDVIIHCHRFHKETNEYRLTYRIQWELRYLPTNETLFGFGWGQSFYAKKAKDRQWVAEVLRHVRREIRHRLLTHYANLRQSPSYSQPSWQPPAALDA